MTRNSGTILTLPPWQNSTNSSSSASRDTINSTASSANNTQVTLSGFGSRIRYIYGRCSVGAVIPTVAKSGNDLLVLCVFSANPSIEVESMWLGDDLYTGDIHLYLGDQTEPDSWLSSAIDGYTDVLAGYTYCVLKIKKSGAQTANWTNIRAVIKGQPIEAGYDNPAHIMAHFAENHMNLAIEQTGLLEAAARCDELIDGERRRVIGLSLDSYTLKGNILATLAEYAGCYYSIQNNTLVMIAKMPRDISHAITQDHIIKNTLSLSRLSLAEIPNRINISYTVPSDNQAWTTSKVRSSLDHITNLRESNISMPAFISASTATRYAIERLNEKNNADLKAVFSVAMIVANQLKKGEVIALSSNLGITNKPFVILNIERESDNRAKITATEYDESMFSDVIVTSPSNPDTDLPKPEDVDPVTGLFITEVLKERSLGNYDSYLVISYDHDISHSDYEVLVYNNSDLSKIVYQTQTKQTQITTSALAEYQTYTVKVRALNRYGFASDYISGEITTNGKLTPPTNVPSMVGVERGGIVFLNWTTSYDMDLRDYIVRWMPEGDAWDSEFAKTGDVVKSLQLQLTEIPAGRWDFCVKARDWSGNLSKNEARVTVDVDEEAALAGDLYTFETYHLDKFEQIGASIYEVPNTRYITSYPEPIEDMLTGTLDQYTDQLVNYHSEGTASIATETHDYGISIPGSFKGMMSVDDIGGESKRVQLLSLDNVTVIKEPLSAIGTYRYAALSLETKGACVVTPPMSVSALAKERVEKGSVSASKMVDGQTYRVYLTGKYYDLVDITVKTAGANYTAGYEDVVLSLTDQNYFDVFIADQNNDLVARNFTYIFTGR